MAHANDAFLRLGQETMQQLHMVSQKWGEQIKENRQLRLTVLKLEENLRKLKDRFDLQRCCSCLNIDKTDSCDHLCDDCTAELEKHHAESKAEHDKNKTTTANAYSLEGYLYPTFSFTAGKCADTSSCVESESIFLPDRCKSDRRWRARHKKKNEIRHKRVRLFLPDF